MVDVLLPMTEIMCETFRVRAERPDFPTALDAILLDVVECDIPTLGPSRLKVGDQICLAEVTNAERAWHRLEEAVHDFLCLAIPLPCVGTH